MKQKRNSNLKEFWFHSEPTVIGTNFHSDGEFIVTYSGLFNPGVMKLLMEEL